jgi:hypothetical protein
MSNAVIGFLISTWHIILLGVAALIFQPSALPFIAIGWVAAALVSR